MFTRKELEDLVNSDLKGHKVLSLYLTTELTQHLKEERRLALRKLLGSLGEDAQPDAERVLSFFDREFDWQAQGIALFSSVAADYWRVIRLAVPVMDFAAWEDKPNVRVLADLLEEHPGTIVALVDRDHARFFVIQMGEIDEFSRELPPTPGRQKGAGLSAARWQRRGDTLGLLNLKQSARLASDLCRRSGISNLILAGTEDVLAQFRTLLPKALQKQVVGELAMDMHAPAKTVFGHARDIVQNLKRDHEVGQVEALSTAARRRRPSATLGLADTLNAVIQGNVLRLVAAADYRAEGYTCDHCRYLSAQELARCPLCGADMRRVDQVVDLVVEKAIQSGSHVELVHGPAAAKLEALGAIGAMLRF